MISYQKMVQDELGGLYGHNVIREMNEIIGFYEFYDGKGQVWTINEGLDYTPTRKITNHTKKLIKKQASFMFGRTPEIKLKAKKEHEESVKQVEEIEQVVSEILKKNKFSSKLIKGARDCFIGKRVAIKLWGGKDKGIKIMFKNSLEFVYDTDPDDVDTLSKIIFFYQTNDKENKEDQRIWKQKFEMVEGRCVLNEGVYDGFGRLVEESYTNYDTYLDFIPAMVVVNDGLSGDVSGESDVAELMENADLYNKMKSDDMDALKFNMFPQRIAKDADGESLKSVKISPGALIDLQTDPTRDNGQADMSMLESSFSYDQRFENAINRVKNDMHELLEIPNISLEQLKGLMQSGKSMKALYWGLICRCEEKWTVWHPVLEWLIDSIIKIVKVYKIEKIPEVEYTINIEHLYPIIEDEEAERQIDLTEVAQQVRSRRSYIKKWNINEKEDVELQKIVEEQGMLQDQFMQNVDEELDGDGDGE